MLTASVRLHRELFQALDVDQEGTLSMKEAAMGDGKFKLLAISVFRGPFSVKRSESMLEVDFLDDWDLDLEEELPESQSRRPSNQPRPTSPVNWIVITVGCYCFQS